MGRKGARRTEAVLSPHGSSQGGLCWTSGRVQAEPTDAPTRRGVRESPVPWICAAFTPECLTIFQRSLYPIRRWSALSEQVKNNSAW